MRVLIVGMASSVHIARFVDLLADAGHELHVFDATLDTTAHGDLRGCVLHCTAPAGPPPAGVTPGTAPPADGPRRQADHLEHVMATVRPDLVHVQETTVAGGLLDLVLREGDGELGVPWLLTNWGSDLYWFGRQPAHVPALRRVMAACPNLTAECHRDIALARAFGFRGHVLGVWPVAGGVDPGRTAALRAPGPTSSRRAVAVKGVMTGYGRALVALEAVARCGDLLGGWELLGHQMDDRADARAREVAAATGMRYTMLSDVLATTSSHDELLAMHGRARVSIGLNRSDGLSTAFVEAIAMGAFAVQGEASCGYELTPAGRGALFVPPGDVDAVTAAVRRALTDDALVDGAAALNARVIAEHLDRPRVRSRVLDAYERVVAGAALEAAA